MPKSVPLIAAIEAGGTKFNCAVGTSAGELGAMERIATTHEPAEDNARGAGVFLKRRKENGDRSGHSAWVRLGRWMCTKTAGTYGFITTDTEAGLAECGFAGGRLRETIWAWPMGFDTDVNAAALGEHTWGRGTGM